jgi:hypothetical protein
MLVFPVSCSMGMKRHEIGIVAVLILVGSQDFGGPQAQETRCRRHLREVFLSYYSSIIHY